VIARIQPPPDSYASSSNEIELWNFSS
jgi:hypothetical protein